MNDLNIDNNETLKDIQAAEDCELVEVGKVSETAGGFAGSAPDTGNGFQWG